MPRPISLPTARRGPAILAAEHHEPGGERQEADEARIDQRRRAEIRPDVGRDQHPADDHRQDDADDDRDQPRREERAEEVDGRRYSTADEADQDQRMRLDGSARYAHSSLTRSSLTGTEGRLPALARHGGDASPVPQAPGDRARSKELQVARRGPLTGGWPGQMVSPDDEMSSSQRPVTAAPPVENGTRFAQTR